MRIALQDQQLVLDTVPVEFSIVSPGHSLIDDTAGAPVVETGGLIK
jgi:hypothetical protein